ncbi:MAG TPA: cell division protein ZipA C-terminal FtsZ-binding domain-containing protein, partial [Massilibacterium sp.]|nr:cell division protein ZipA C-terminal FtsZ-binding domain-containing protein [Massilibacterium sp.]
LQLPAPIDSLKAFDDLDDTAHRLADRLGGELRDETRSPLSRQRIDNLSCFVEQLWKKIARRALMLYLDG